MISKLYLDFIWKLDISFISIASADALGKSSPRPTLIDYIILDQNRFHFFSSLRGVVNNTQSLEDCCDDSHKTLY